jgi:hypothetical protein
MLRRAGRRVERDQRPAIADRGIYYVKDNNNSANKSTEVAAGAEYSLSKSTLGIWRSGTREQPGDDDPDDRIWPAGRARYGHDRRDGGLAPHLLSGSRYRRSLRAQACAMTEVRSTGKGIGRDVGAVWRRNVPVSRQVRTLLDLFRSWKRPEG